MRINRTQVIKPRYAKKSSILRVKTTYSDKVSIDNSELVFYIYSLGNYHNTPMYHYGETIDLYMTECSLKKQLPVYERVMCTPIDDKHNSLQMFREFLNKNHKTTALPVVKCEHLEVFTCNDQHDFEMILGFIDTLYQPSSL